MYRRIKLAAIVALSGAASLAFAQPASAAPKDIYDSEGVLIASQSTFTVTADGGPTKISGHELKIGAIECSASSQDRGGSTVKTSGYLDTTLTAYGAKLDSASASASFDGLGGSVTASTTKVTFHGPRVKWSNSGGKGYTKTNITIDGGNASTWSYVRLTCDGTVTSTSRDVTVEAGGRS